MEIKEISEALDRIEGKMNETAESNKAEMKRLGDMQTKFARELMDVQQNAVKAMAPRLKRSLLALRLLNPAL